MVTVSASQVPQLHGSGSSSDRGDVVHVSGLGHAPFQLGSQLVLLPCIPDGIIPLVIPLSLSSVVSALSVPLLQPCSSPLSTPKYVGDPSNILIEDPSIPEFGATLVNLCGGALRAASRLPNTSL